jgi:phospholipase C
LGPSVELVHGLPPDRLAPDPKHNFNDTHAQIYDAPWPAGGTANMRGFARNYCDKQLNDPKLSLSERRALLQHFTTIYAEDRLPVLHTLAKQYAVCTHWYSSLPSLTSPNRAFAHAGTTRGEIEQATSRWLKLIGDITVFDLLPRSANAWRVYHDGPPHLWIMGDEWLLDKKDNFRAFHRFRDDVEAGSLPSYTFIEPRHFGLFEHGNSQHPPQRVSAGERLIASVYDTLLSNFELFQQTLLLIVYDEHGGFFDHVVPPGHPGWDAGPHTPHEVVPPGNEVAHNGFRFDQLGVRVPAVLISPWLDAGTTAGWQAADPALRRTFDHTTIVATVDHLEPHAHVLRHSQRAQMASALNLPARATARSRAECPGPLLPSFSEAHYRARPAPLLRGALAPAHAALEDGLVAPSVVEQAELDSGPERELLDLWENRSGNRDWRQLEAHVETLMAGDAAAPVEAE